MKKEISLQKVLALAFAILACHSALAAYYDFKVDGIYYNIISEEDRTVEVTNDEGGSYYSGGSYSAKELVIPSKVINQSKTYTVVSIGSFAFFDCVSLTSIELPSSLTTIGSYAFGGSSLTSIELPSNLTTIGGHAFYNCSSLTSIELPSNLTTIEEYAFQYCSNLTSIELPSSLTTIEENAFFDCGSLTSIELPSSLTTIEEYAFRYCSNLTSIELPSSLTTIYGSTFEGCDNLSAINVDKNNQSYVSEDGILYTKDMTELVRFPEGKTTANFKIPNSVTTIGDNAFYGCGSLTSIELPVGLTTVGYRAFQYCSSLTSVYCKATIPPACDGNIFGDVTLKGTLYVPIGTKADYEAVDPWRNFWTIEETYFTVGVEDAVQGEEVAVATDGNSIVVTGDDAGRIEVYSVNGQCVYSGQETTIGGLAKGVYVVKVGNNTYKVLL